MRVWIFVEGPSDKDVLKALLLPLLQPRRVGLHVVSLGGKDAVLNDAPRQAAARLTADPAALVIAMPDLHPMAKYDATPNRHRNVQELRSVMTRSFTIFARGLSAATRERFRVHCFKHDLEVLLLASPEALYRHLRQPVPSRMSWRHPVEDQNDVKPPKRVVEELFKKHTRSRYIETLHAPTILERASLASLELACPQCFAPFVEDIRRALP